MLSVLRDNGFDDQSAIKMYAAIHTYTIGFASLEASRLKSGAHQAVTEQVVGQLMAFTTTDQFLEGLNLIVDGIESRMAN